MAKGLAPNRRRMQSRDDLLHEEPGEMGCANMPAGDESSHLDLSIKQAIQRRGGKQVKAFVVMALHDDGNISTVSDHIQRCTDSIFTRDAEDRLRIAHRASVMETRNGQGRLNIEDQDLISPSSVDEMTDYEAYHNNAFDHFARSLPTDSVYDDSRPVSAHSLGTPNDWPSDVDDSEPVYRKASTGTKSGSRRAEQMESLEIGEGPKIEAFLVKRLRNMQQLAVKRIAKAWIKRICPKKQASFPYHKKKRQREGLDHLTGFIPGWWPATKLCRFVEPDHIKRDERIQLCLHLLRLRPSPATLKMWNKGSVEPHQTHVTKGWTEFLKELAPPGIFDDMREPDGKTQQERQKLLAEIYDLAKKEEEFMNGDCDANDRYYWRADPADEKPASRKRGRRSYQPAFDESDTDSYADSAPPCKMSKKASLATTPARSPASMQHTDVEFDDRMQDCKPQLNASFLPALYSSGAAATSPTEAWTHYVSSCDSKPHPALIHNMHEQPQALQTASYIPRGYATGSPWVNNPSPAPFSESERQAVSQAFAMEPPTTTFPGHRDFQFPQNLEQMQSQLCPTYMTAHVPQPQFENIPANTMYGLSQSPHPGQQQMPYMNGVYYSQPNGAQQQLFAVPGTPVPSPQFNMSMPPNMSFPCSAGPERCYTADPANFHQHPEPGHSEHHQYTDFRHCSDFQAPARVERGFTGHGSGVGGGAHT